MRKIFLLVTISIFCQFSFAQDSKGVGNIITERKIALVIGNTNYDSGVGRLKNPVNDARDMADALQRLGFTLVGGKAQLDVNKRQMLDLIREFGSQIKQGGVGFFYFSGHGVQVDKRNYIIPITDTLVYEDEAETEAVEVDTVAKEMEYAGNRLNILVLDACRNNELRKRTKNTSKGLTEPTRKPKGTFIAFAADDGQTASDNSSGRNGLFTQELLKNLQIPKLRIEDVFKNTRVGVESFSNGGQSPMFVDKTNGIIVLNSGSNRIDSNDLTSTTPGSQNETGVIETPALQNATFNYKSNETLTIGSGNQKFTTKWSSCSSDCVYLISDYLDGIANSRVENFDEIRDVTAFDRSSRVRTARINQILVLKNSDDFYALVQVKTVNYSSGEVSINYKIYPESKKSTWQPNPTRYVSTSKSGRVKFEFEDNNGDFVIGSGRNAFSLDFGGSSKKEVRLYNDNGISIISINETRKPREGGRIADVSGGDIVIIENKNRIRAKITIVSATSQGGDDGDIDEVIFDYEIFSSD